MILFENVYLCTSNDNIVFNGTLCGQTVVSLSAILIVDAGNNVRSYGLYAVSPAIAPLFEVFHEVRFLCRQVRPFPPCELL
jgi:hypothetical protein